MESKIVGWEIVDQKEAKSDIQIEKRFEGGSWRKLKVARGILKKWLDICRTVAGNLEDADHRHKMNARILGISGSGNNNNSSGGRLERPGRRLQRGPAPDHRDHDRVDRCGALAGDVARPTATAAETLAGALVEDVLVNENGKVNSIEIHLVTALTNGDLVGVAGAGASAGTAPPSPLPLVASTTTIRETSSLCAQSCTEALPVIYILETSFRL
ncbi:hypothetical protein QBC45DRAFT_392078 [Copromyces sp. CBS 386.78]|nr:hypothetical protein QBC45DRAFT_392078 [Copromyces sp. CBS 386.78]